MNREHARVGDITVSYLEAGTGPAIVLVHGLAEDAETWLPQLETVTDRHLYAVEVRGHGQTGTGTADGTLAQLAADLVGFLEKVSGPAVCVGFSLGGTVVLGAAAQRPDLVRGAIVLGTSTVVGRAAVEFYRSRIALVEFGDSSRITEALRADSAAGLHVEPEQRADALVGRRVAAIRSGAGYVNAARAMVALSEHPLTPALDGIRCPVVVIGAEHDKFCPRRAADIILARLPRARYREIPAAGHLMNVDNPDAVSAALSAEWKGMDQA